MHGEDGDQGTSVFHATLFVGPIVMGGFASAETPELFGPRKVGQEGGALWTAKTEAAPTAQSNRNFIGWVSCVNESKAETRGGQRLDCKFAPIAETLFFAGEATASDAQTGTVFGAYESGIRVAKVILHQS